MNQKKKWKFDSEYFLVGVPFYITGGFFFRTICLISVDDAWLSAAQACATLSYPSEVICVLLTAGMALLCFYTVITWAISLAIWFFWRKFHKK